MSLQNNIIQFIYYARFKSVRIWRYVIKIIKRFNFFCDKNCSNAKEFLLFQFIDISSRLKEITTLTTCVQRFL